MISYESFVKAMGLLNGHYNRRPDKTLLNAYWKILKARTAMDDEWLERGVMAAIATEPFFPPLDRLYELGRPVNHRPENRQFKALPEPVGLSAEQRQGLDSVKDVIAGLRQQRQLATTSESLPETVEDATETALMPPDMAELWELSQQFRSGDEAA